MKAHGKTEKLKSLCFPVKPFYYLFKVNDKEPTTSVDVVLINSLVTLNNYLPAGKRQAIFPEIRIN